jgi:hypothetical protein
MRFMSSAEEIEWRELKDQVELFISNLQWGYISIDYRKFGKEGKKLAQQLYANIRAFQRDDFCYSDDENYKPKHILWLFDFFTKARCYGALIGILRDKTYEDKIEELEADNKRLAENLAAVIKTDEAKSESFEAVK